MHSKKPSEERCNPAGIYQVTGVKRFGRWRRPRLLFLRLDIVACDTLAPASQLGILQELER